MKVKSKSAQSMLEMPMPMDTMSFIVEQKQWKRIFKKILHHPIMNSRFHIFLYIIKTHALITSERKSSFVAI